MDALAEKLDARLRDWKPETAAEARERIAEFIETRRSRRSGPRALACRRTGGPRSA